MTAPAAVAPGNRLWWYVILAIALGLAWWYLFGRGPDGQTAPSRDPAAAYAEEYGGDVGRYEAILRITDCATLGRMFSAGKANFDNNAPGGRDLWRGQMAATDDRMDDLGCP